MTKGVAAGCARRAANSADAASPLGLRAAERCQRLLVNGAVPDISSIGIGLSG